MDFTKKNITLPKKTTTPFVTPPTIIQKKLSIGASNDAYEVEADCIADKVIGMSDVQAQKQTQTGTLVQRKCATCDEDHIQKKSLVDTITPHIQRVSENSANRGVASDSITSQINSSKGAGSLMESSTKNYMESRFGTDFSGVQIHTGNNAIQLSRQLNAQAFTVGNDIYFNEGKYNPSSNSGKHLLAHELTHTLQQGNNLQKRIQKYSTEDCSTTDKKKLAKAVKRSKEMLTKAISRLTASPITASTKKLFGYHFGVYANWRRKIILWHFRRDLDLLKTWNFTFECENECSSGAPAYTYWIFGDIHICPNFFSTGLNEQGETIIHELHHLDKVRGQLDLGYHKNNKDNKTSWLIAVNNADSHSELCQDLYEQP